MKTDKQKVKRISLRLRDGCPQHQALLRYCQKRDKEKYHSMTDYLACAVEAFETEKYIPVCIDQRVWCQYRHIRRIAEKSQHYNEHTE